MMMSETLLALVKTFAGFFVVLGAWCGFQALLRRHSGCGREKDMLQFILGGCGGCVNRGACESKKGKGQGKL